MIGTTLSRRYRLESKLGSGGMSTVYLAHDETLERWVAVKIMHREIVDDVAQLERFRREARAVAQLSHPNVVAVIDAGEDGGHPYIVFEYVEGETLKQRIERLGRLPLDESAAYAIEVGRGLAAAHSSSLVHRDVKPQNVLVDAEGRAKVTDFGIARSLESKGLTATGRVLGTTDYVSPEQAMGYSVDARSDIYSLGVVIYEMLVGRPPFTAETLVGVAMKHVNEQMPNVQIRRPETSAALSAVVERSTVKDPRERYADMNEMLAELEDALEVEVARAGGSGTGEATAVLKSVPERRRRLSPSRRVSLAGVLLVVAAGAAALAVAALTGEEGPSREPSPSGGEPVATEAAADFDPEGDNTELPSEVDKAIDGNAGTTAWVSEHYDTETFGNLKSGVGLYFEVPEPVAASEIEVRSVESGWTAEVYAAQSGPPDDLAEWDGPLASLNASETQVTAELDAATEYTYYLLWFTKLPPASDEDRFRIEISDVRLFA